MPRLPLPSLRYSLIAAFAAVIALSLFLASAAFAYLLREDQTRREQARLEALATSYNFQLARAIRNGRSEEVIDDMLDQDASASGVRILLLDDHGVIRHDTADLWLGREFPLPPTRGPRASGGFTGILTGPGSGEQVFTVAPSPLAGMRVAVVAAETTLSNAWREALPRLSLAALGALVVSIAIAYWFASTITRPILQITRASEEMARGNYDPELVLPETSDEVGRLSTAFVSMAREVAGSHRAMRDLLANVSHDLRTPLTSIQGFAGALVDGTLAGPEGAREAGRVIGEEAERMRRLVEDLLYLGRIESGDIALDRRPLDLAAVARAALPRFTFRAQESGMDFHVLAPEPVAVAGDPHRLAQVLDNLLENALRFTPPGGAVEVAVRREPGRPPAGQRPARPVATALLSVHNTGSFIPQGEVERVFERFYQVDKARSRRDGRGLGLAIAREIVQAHGGSIAVRSSAAEGTTFEVRLPLLETATGPRLSSSEPEAPADSAARVPLRR